MPRFADGGLFGLTQVPAGGRLAGLIPLAEVHRDASAVEVGALQLLARAGCLLVGLVLGEAVAPRLFGLASVGPVGGGVRLIDDVAVIKFAVLREGRVETFLAQTLIDVADVEAGVCIEGDVLSSSRAGSFRTAAA